MGGARFSFLVSELIGRDCVFRDVCCLVDRYVVLWMVCVYRRSIPVGRVWSVWLYLFPLPSMSVCFLFLLVQ